MVVSSAEGVIVETGVSVGDAVSDGELRLCDFRGVGVGDGAGRAKSFFNLSPSVSFSS